MKKKEKKNFMPPTTNIASAVIAAIITISGFMSKGAPYDSINLSVFLTVFFSSILKIVVPFLAIYIILTFINSKGDEIINQRYIHKLYELSVKLLVSVFFFTIGIIILILFAMSYPWVIGWLSNAIIYTMVGVLTVYLEVGTLNRGEKIRNSAIPVFWILGLLYFVNQQNIIFFVSYVVVSFLLMIIIILKALKSKK